MPDLGIASAVLDAARNRGRLALAESKLALRELLGIGAVLVTSLFLAILFGLGLTFAFAALVWDTDHRVAWLVGLATVYALGSIGSLLWAVRRFKEWKLYEATAGQLSEDCEALQRHFKESR